jgi:aromatic-L-amino-acid decarboxylase
VRRVAADERYRMIPEALQEAIEEDRREGWQPFCVVGTLGTTSSTAIDPAAAIAEICEREKLWFHVDAAYGAAAALAPENRHLFDGWERADSIVFNPHKWMFTPFDASLLLFRHPDVYRDAFSLVPEYIKTPVKGGAHNYSEYGIQMGRRFRALKLWMLIRYFGADGIAARIREHCRMAREFAGWVEEAPEWEMLAPVPFATVCFRHVPPKLAGLEEPERSAELDRHNEALMAAVNRDGRIFLSHTKLRGRYTIRVVIGNPRQTEKHVATCWELLQQAARELDAD